MHAGSLEAHRVTRPEAVDSQRIDRATTVSEAQYRKFRRREAEKLGLTLDDEG
jgi:hypothetical protein